MVKKKSNSKPTGKIKTNKKSVKKTKCTKPCSKQCVKKQCVKKPEPEPVENIQSIEKPKQTIFSKLLSILGITR